ncbi:hypothetical protein [Dyadobacter sp. CY323]|uniref:hypothetical protein n=1 Tax=Dyadobacter sp. CY323 TaxID=2907302 RepID=UPI001F29BBB8|nr:hypothetical protein [Dyadobacter sp. CY323]MCE6989187.1 hypothetical protein [Dyadobacter sp. CY323]
MKTIKILFIFTLLSLHAGATGYVHNMFVAHKKLQAGKEIGIEKVVAKKAAPVMKVKNAQVKQASFFKNSQISESITLNERMLKEGPVSFFTNEKEEESDESMVSKLVSVVRCVIYAFVGTPHLGNS